MSESSQTVVRLDTDLAVAQVANRVLAFLLDRRIVVRNERRQALWHPSEWAHGPAWRSVVAPDESPDWTRLANNGVDVIVERALHHPTENYEPPWCDRCRTVFDEIEHHAAAEGWILGEEPTLTCHGCGWSALAGDWPAEWALAVGAPAVEFHNWPPLTERFVSDLRDVVGGRTQFVRAHY